MSAPLMFIIPTRIYDEEQPEEKLLLFPRMTGKEVTKSTTSESVVKCTPTTVRPRSTVSFAVQYSLFAVKQKN